MQTAIDLVNTDIYTSSSAAHIEHVNSAQGTVYREAEEIKNTACIENPGSTELENRIAELLATIQTARSHP
ncbi:MAG: hypothetical protein M3Y27_06820 [Acidobacteriota bacterium]|nr:hypothetical protein [Acidobacteriota bacterium]